MRGEFFDLKFIKILLAILAANIFFCNLAECSTLMKKLPVEVIDSGGTLIFSDSPEYVKEDGILYTDAVQGDVRVLFYHLNDTSAQKKIAVVVEDVSGKNNTVRITRKTFPQPSPYYLSVGKEAQLAYMQSDFHDTLKFKPRERKILQQEMNLTTLEPGYLAYGVYDFHTDKLVQVYVVMCPADVNPLYFIHSAKILPKDEHRLRGTFKNMNRTIRLKNIYNPATDGLGYVLIGDDANDKYRRGIDATDGSKVTNEGNYGINYTLEFRTKSLTRFYLSPLGGTYAGAVRFKSGKNFGMIPTPAGKIFFGETIQPEPEEVRIAREEGMAFLTNQLELSELGDFEGKVFFEYSPPGASNLPVHFILKPVN